MRDLDSMSLRERIDGLQQHEALMVALDAYDALRCEVRASVADVAQATGLSPAPALVLLTLWEARGRVVTHDAMAARFREAAGWHMSESAYRTAVKRIRRAHPETVIINHARLGYRLPRPLHWRAPWETDQCL